MSRLIELVREQILAEGPDEFDGMCMTCIMVALGTQKLGS